MPAAGPDVVETGRTTQASGGRVAAFGAGPADFPTTIFISAVSQLRLSFEAEIPKKGGVRVPGAFGPILTTGLALSTAVVVVTNPVTAPHADVRIPATQAQVSNTGQAVDMLDEDFIKAVGPTPAGSTNPLAVLKDLVSILVADAADFGKSAVMRAFMAGAGAVSRSNVPELTALTYPYVVPAAPDVLPALPWTPAPVPEDLRPVVEQALTALITDAGDFVDPSVVAAAFIAGAALAAGESPILGDLRGLVGGGLQPALNDATPVVSALRDQAIGGVIRDAVERLPAVAAPVLSRRDPASGSGLPAAGAPTVDTEDAEEPANRFARSVAAERGLHPLPSIGGGVDSSVDSRLAKPVSPKRIFSGVGTPGAAGQVGADRNGSAATAGPIGRPAKTIADRVRG